MYLRVSSLQRIYARSSYTMMAYLGDLGGLIDIIWITGALITTILTKNLFEAAMIKNSYKIQKYTHDDAEFYATEGGTDK